MYSARIDIVSLTLFLFFGKFISSTFNHYPNGHAIFPEQKILKTHSPIKACKVIWKNIPFHPLCMRACSPPKNNVSHRLFLLQPSLLILWDILGRISSKNRNSLNSKCFEVSFRCIISITKSTSTFSVNILLILIKIFPSLTEKNPTLTLNWSRTRPKTWWISF